MENNTPKNLYDILVTRDFEPEILDSSGKSVADPNEAELFSFDWKTDGRNYGTVVILLGSSNDLEIYYGDNLGRGMDSEDRGAWYDFLAQMKNFATRNMLSFKLNNINRLKYTMQGMAAIREGLFEGYYGRKNISYSDQPKQTRLMIRHDRNLAEGEPRYRAIESLFVETADGERFRVPSRSLAHGRMLARHIAEGGTPYDAFGQHITDVVNEINVLSKFIRASRNRGFEGPAAGMVETAVKHYSDLKAKAKRMISQRGYREEREQFDPAQEQPQDHMISEIRDMFIEQTLDSRIEEALPVLASLSRSAMREVQEFDAWTQEVTDRADLPTAKGETSQLEELMAQPLPVGPDAINAIEQLNDIITDDALFRSLEDLAAQDPEADARPLIQQRMEELGIEIRSGDQKDGMGEDLDTDGVMMTRPSNMSSESRDPGSTLARLIELVKR
jgi:hypothetical protein